MFPELTSKENSQKIESIQELASSKIKNNI
jgi:hypothetical protein